MIITDSSALIAVLNAEDPAHARCAEAIQFLQAQPLLITVPSFVEAMYFLGKLGGFVLQNCSVAKSFSTPRDGAEQGQAQVQLM